MAALDFPNSPAFGDTYVVAGITWTCTVVGPPAQWTGSAQQQAIATTAQWLADVAGLLLGTDNSWGAAAPVGLTDAATIAVDMSTFINATVTLAGNRTLANPTNTKNGQSGYIEIKQDGTGSRTLAYGANWKWPSGVAPVLSVAGGARDMLFYQVISSTVIMGVLVKAVA